MHDPGSLIRNYILTLPDGRFNTRGLMRSARPALVPPLTVTNCTGPL